MYNFMQNHHVPALIPHYLGSAQQVFSSTPDYYFGTVGTNLVNNNMELEYTAQCSCYHLHAKYWNYNKTMEGWPSIFVLKFLLSWPCHK